MEATPLEPIAGSSYGKTLLVEKDVVTIVPCNWEIYTSALMIAAEAGADAFNVLATSTEYVEWPGSL